MKFNSGRYAIAAALVAALAAAWAHRTYVASLDKKESIVVATGEVTPFTKLSDSNLKIVEVPANALPADAVRSLDAAKGKYTRALLVQGEMLRTSHLVNTNSDGSPMVVKLMDTGVADARAMAIKVTPESGVANTVRPGDQVDVLVALRVENGPQRYTFSKIIASGVPVLYTSFSGKSDSLSVDNKEGTVVLQVKPELAEDIAFAQTSGNIWLLTTAQSAELQTKGVSLDMFLKKYGVTNAPAMTPPAAPASAQTATQKGG